MIPKSGNGFRKRSCFNNKVERDDDSKKSHPALACVHVMLNHLLGVMAGQQPVEDGRERPYVPAIHVFLAEGSQPHSL